MEATIVTRTTAYARTRSEATGVRVNRVTRRPITVVRVLVS